MSLVNPFFSVAGPDPGTAVGWHLTSYCRSEHEGASFRGPTDIDAGEMDDFSAFTTTAVTVTTLFVSDPSGGNRANRIRETAVNALHRITNPDTFVSATAGVYGVTVYMRSAGHNIAYVGIDGGGGSEGYVVVNLDEGRVIRTYASADIDNVVGLVERITVTVGATPADWCRITIMFETASVLTLATVMGLDLDGAFSGAYMGALARDVYAWGHYAWVPPLASTEAFDRGWSGSETIVSAIVIPTNGEPVQWDTDFVTNTTHEEFESGWSNYPLLTEVVGAASTWDTGLEAAEDFEEEWDNAAIVTTVSGTTSTWDTGLEAAEDFEEEWNNATIVTTVSGTTAAWDTSTLENAEDFEEVRRDRVYSVNTTTDVLTSVAHGFVDDDTLYVLAPVGGALPEPLNATVKYYVVSATADTLKLALTLAGAAIDITTAGVGEQVLQGDPATFWNELDYNELLD